MNAHSPLWAEGWGAAHQHRWPGQQDRVLGGHQAPGFGPQARPGCRHPSLDMGVQLWKKPGSSKSLLSQALH